MSEAVAVASSSSGESTLQELARSNESVGQIYGFIQHISYDELQQWARGSNFDIFLVVLKAKGNGISDEVVDNNNAQFHSLWTLLRNEQTDITCSDEKKKSIEPHVFANKYEVNEENFTKTGMKEVNITEPGEDTNGPITAFIGGQNEQPELAPVEFTKAFMETFIHPVLKNDVKRTLEVDNGTLTVTGSENCLWDQDFASFNFSAVMNNPEFCPQEVLAYHMLKVIWEKMISNHGQGLQLWKKLEQFQAHLIGTALYGLPCCVKEECTDTWVAGADSELVIKDSPVIVTQHDRYEQAMDDSEAFKKWKVKPDFFLLKQLEEGRFFQFNVEEKIAVDPNPHPKYKALTTGALSLKSMSVQFKKDVMFHLAGTRCRHEVILILLCLESRGAPKFMYATRTYNLENEVELKKCAKVLWNYAKRDVLSQDTDLVKRSSPLKVVTPSETVGSKSQPAPKRNRDDGNDADVDNNAGTDYKRQKREGAQSMRFPKDVQNVSHVRMLTLSESESPKVGEVVSGELNGARVYVKCTEYVAMDIDIHEKLSRIMGLNLPRIICYSEEEQWYIMSDVGVSRCRPTTQHTLMKVMRRTLEQIMILHNAGWIHRDIKPSNLCVNRVSLDVTLIDWEFAMEIDHDNLPTDRVGTEGFMAPEVDAEEPYSFSCDVYSMGRALKRMSSGVRGELDSRLLEIMDSLCEKDAAKRLGIRDALDRLTRVRADGFLLSGIAL